MTITVDRPKAKLLAPIAANVPTMGSVIDALWSLSSAHKDLLILDK